MAGIGGVHKISIVLMNKMSDDIHCGSFCPGKWVWVEDIRI